MARTAEREGLTYERYLHALADLEAHERYNRKVASLLKHSRLPREKTLETFNLERLSK